MKAPQIVAIVLIVLGIMLLCIGYLFRIMHWPDMFYGLISGPVLFVSGTVLLAFSYFRKNS